ncbi:hypothetical protein R69746_03075 [Paraburkholderia aspalathi]|jgi:hypothetical protein|nr:hypothetical protein R69746_03075 [Paraburkholderia aspalathi]
MQIHAKIGRWVARSARTRRPRQKMTCHDPLFPLNVK